MARPLPRPSDRDRFPVSWFAITTEAAMTEGLIQVHNVCTVNIG